MRTLAIAVLAAAAGCASVASNDDPHILNFTDAELAMCMDDGGCVVISRGYAKRMFKKALDDAGCVDASKRSESFNLKGIT